MNISQTLPKNMLFQTTFQRPSTYRSVAVHYGRFPSPFVSSGLSQDRPETAKTETQRLSLVTDRRTLVGIGALTCGNIGLRTERVLAYEKGTKRQRKRRKPLVFPPEDVVEMEQESEGGTGATWLVGSEGEASLVECWGDSMKCFNDYSKSGPYQVKTMKGMEYKCEECVPVGAKGELLLVIDASFPDMQSSQETFQETKNFPLAIFTSGYMIDSSQYRSYSEHLASWGYIVLTYNKREKLSTRLNDLDCARIISELINWANTNSIFENLLGSQRVYLCGHSRGAKVSVLAASQDERVAAICILDPVDNTAYAPLAPGYPSAVEALLARERYDTEMRGEVNEKKRERNLPVLVVGAALVGNCAPLNANFRRFFRAAPAPSWELVLLEAAHLQFLDSPPIFESDVCGNGNEEDSVISFIARTVMAVWGDFILKEAYSYKKQQAIPSEGVSKEMTNHLESNLEQPSSSVCPFEMSGILDTVTCVTKELGQVTPAVSRVKVKMDD